MRYMNKGPKHLTCRIEDPPDSARMNIVSRADQGSQLCLTSVEEQKHLDDISEYFLLIGLFDFDNDHATGLRHPKQEVGTSPHRFRHLSRCTESGFANTLAICQAHLVDNALIKSQVHLVAVTRAQNVALVLEVVHHSRQIVEGLPVLNAP